METIDYIYQVQRYWEDREEWMIYAEYNTAVEAQMCVDFWVQRGGETKPMRVKRSRI